jgi:nucleoside 2-deoxyribosyltransferase
MSKIYIYLAGPVKGKSESDACSWRDSFTECLQTYNRNFIGVSPLRCEAPGADGNYPDNYDWALSQQITHKNLLDVKRCDAVLAYLPDAESLGTQQEIGWSVGLSKTIILLTNETSIAMHPILRATVPFIYSTNKCGIRKALETIDGLYGVYT